MRLIYKQLYKQIAKGKIFLLLLLLLAALTSLSFFFVMFSIDGNMAALHALPALNENQQLYENALNANTTLAYNFLLSLTGLTGFVLVMFFYRFFRANKKQIGCIKSLGFKDSALRWCFVAFVAGLAIVGALLGLLGGYFLSSVLVNANTQTYAVTGLVKGISASSLSIGLLGPAVVFCIVAFLCYGFVRGREPGALLSGSTGQNRISAALKIADIISRIAPKNRRLSLRIALRKPLAIVLIIVAVMAFTVCMVLGRSLNISSAKVFDNQTTGHNYEYDTRFLQYQTKEAPKEAVAYLNSPATITVGGFELERTVTGLYNLNEVFELQNAGGTLLDPPETGAVYIGPELSDIYGVSIGDALQITIAGTPYSFAVADIAANATSGTVYMSGTELAELLGTSPVAYNGVYSKEPMPGGEAVTKAQRIDDLNRNAVSNNISAIINQATGALVGAILIFLALYVNFQDNARDMLILSMMGHRIKSIRKMLVDIYRPILWVAFVVTLAPGILLARAIQHSLSISTNDYMPFGTDILVIAISFVLLNVIYWLVQALFGVGIKRTIAKEEISELVYAE